MFSFSENIHALILLQEKRPGKLIKHGIGLNEK